MVETNYFTISSVGGSIFPPFPPEAIPWGGRGGGSVGSAARLSNLKHDANSSTTTTGGPTTLI